MASFYDVDTQELIEQVSVELKKIVIIKPPVWSWFVKTGASRERPPARDDWWHIRSASVLRYVAMKGPIGVQKLRVKYGGKKNRGYKKEHFFKSSGNILRKILQQLEKSELIKQDTRGTHKGRVITAKGKSLLDKTASKIAKSAKIADNTQQQKPKEVKSEPVKEHKKPQEKIKAKEQATAEEEHPEKVKSKEQATAEEKPQEKIKVKEQATIEEKQKEDM